MSEIRREPPHHSGIHLSDLFFALFKRKWTIILCALMGISAAAAFYFFFPRTYASEAKLLVRYVLERSAVDSIDNANARPQDATASNDRVIGAEVQILTSWDLAMEVADAIGAKRLGAASKEAAAGSIVSGLEATTSKGSNTISVSYKNRNPEFATLILQELLSRYFVKHLEVHRSAGAFDFVTQQTDQVRARLSQTEDALKRLRDKAGIVSSLDGASDALSKEMADTQKQLNEAEADVAEQQALVKQIGEKKANSWTTRKSQSNKTPGAEKASLAGKQAKVEALKARLADVQQRAKQLSELRPQIEELERKHDMDANNYKYFAASLEKARIDEALDPSKMPNISAVQRPSPPMLDTKTRNKIALAIAVGGVALGIALALLKGLILNRTVGRPLQLETQLHIPLMLSIPYFKSSRNGQLALPPNGAPTNPKALAMKRHHSKLAPWEPGHFIRPYCEAIRDRLGLYFELNHLTHKPKLVGVAGFSEDAGTSTLAAGLASSLSEANDGKVLLVDVNLGPEEVHPFFKGKPAYPLNAALKRQEKITSAADNLYLATVGRPNPGGAAQIGLKKFFELMPNLKASDFDYIIFDMPPLDQTSPTWGMAAFMDKLLLVVEAEKNHRDLINRSYRNLVAARDNVAVVVNKTRSYIPRWLDSGP
ncbi:MAG TPA: Wzz/FepE/Etk N-terminal domain-containing protein [Pyrinomonadaceae bacterium]|nr:Wzz/FepE/Etk N-terminal domain-containing protein [Pyrinomonadaceae bacterium]